MTNYIYYPLFALIIMLTTLEPNLLFGFLILLMITIGLPHGAMDLFKLWKRNKNILNFSMSSLIYLSISFLMYFIWLSIPTVFWPIFFLVATIHFLAIENNNKSINSPLLAIYTVNILPVLKPQEFIKYMSQINGEVFASYMIQYRLVFLFPFTGYFLWRLYQNRKDYLQLLTYVVFIVFYFKCGLIENFLIYFLVLHSLKHIFMENNYLKDYRVILSLSILSILIVISAGQLWNKTSIDLSIIMSLAMLTFPHFILDLSSKYRFLARLFFRQEQSLLYP